MTERTVKLEATPANTIGVPSVLGNRYELLNEIGAGGMGRVYRARDRETNETLALKVLLPELATNPAMAERFKNELRLARRITHKNVCRIYDFNRTDSLAYITMEYVDGETLRALLTRGGPLSPARLVEIATQICAGLSEAHAQGVVHRDLKPENVMLTKSGQVKLMDFGIARSIDNTTTSHTMIGTPGYMAPEQAQGQPVTARTDIYAFGMIMYECLTGRPAFVGATPIAVALKQIQERPTPPRALRPEIPPVLEANVMRCLEKDPARRFVSAEALVAALTPARAATPPRATKPVVVRRENRPAPSRLPWALAFVAIVAGAMWMMKHSRPTVPATHAATAPSASAPLARERQTSAPLSTPASEPTAVASAAPPAQAPSPEPPRLGSREPSGFGRADSPEPPFDRTAELEQTRAAAEAGDASAQMRLSRALLYGPKETRDAQQAREWMRRAAEQGLPEAQFALGMMYNRGIGGARDRRTGLSWIERAAQGGDKDAQRVLARLREQRPGYSSTGQYSARGQYPQSGQHPPRRLMRPPR